MTSFLILIKRKKEHRNDEENIFETANAYFRFHINHNYIQKPYPYFVMLFVQMCVCCTWKWYMMAQLNVCFVRQRNGKEMWKIVFMNKNEKE